MTTALSSPNENGWQLCAGWRAGRIRKTRQIRRSPTHSGHKALRAKYTLSSIQQPLRIRFQVQVAKPGRLFRRALTIGVAPRPQQLANVWETSVKPVGLSRCGKSSGSEPAREGHSRAGSLPHGSGPCTPLLPRRRQSADTDDGDADSTRQVRCVVEK